MSGGFFRVLAVLGIIGVLVAIGFGSYNAGLTAGLAEQGTAVASGATVVYQHGPYPGHWGWGPGFGIFGIFAWIFVIFLVFALLRAAIGWGRYGRGHGWGDHHDRYGARDHLEDWHRRAHEGGDRPDAAAGGSVGG